MTELKHEDFKDAKRYSGFAVSLDELSQWIKRQGKAAVAAAVMATGGLMAHDADAQTWYEAGVTGGVSAGQIGNFIYQLVDDDYSKGLEQNAQNQARYYSQNQERAKQLIQKYDAGILDVEQVQRAVGSAQMVLRKPNMPLLPTDDISDPQGRAFWQQYYPGIKIMPSHEEQVAVYKQLGKLGGNAGVSDRAKALQDLIEVSPETAYTWLGLQVSAHEEALRGLPGTAEFQMYNKKLKAFKKMQSAVGAVLVSKGNKNAAEMATHIDRIQRANAPWNSAANILNGIVPYASFAHDGCSSTWTETMRVFGRGNLGTALSVIKDLTDGGLSMDTLAQIQMCASNAKYRNAIRALGADMSEVTPMGRTITDVDMAVLRDDVAEMFGDANQTSNGVVRASKYVELANKLFTKVEAGKMLDASRTMDANAVRQQIEKEAKDRNTIQKALQILDIGVSGTVGPRGFVNATDVMKVQKGGKYYA